MLRKIGFKGCLFALIIVLSIQFTDIKFFNIKLGEVFSLFTIFIFLLISQLKLPLFLKKMSYVFFAMLLSSFFVLQWVQIYPIPNTGFLKQAGYVSVARYIQNIGCICFSGIIFIYLKQNKNSIFFLKYIDKLMFLMGCLFIIIWIASFVGLDTIFVYSNHRLRGGYVEGGPFALFYMSYVLLRFLIFGKNYYWYVLGFALIIAAQSKAALLFLFSYFILNTFIMNKIKLKNLIMVPVVITSLLLFANQYFGIFNSLQAYYKDYNNAAAKMITHRSDPSLVMGRIAASHISPKIIQDNFFLGVGSGNYSLVRNNPSYLGVFPVVKEWDLTGLGGIVNILIENGFIGLLIFCIPFYSFFRKTNSKTAKKIILIFFLAQVFGVQTYFQYIWFLMAFVCYYDSIEAKKNITI